VPFIEVVNHIAPYASVFTTARDTWTLHQDIIEVTLDPTLIIGLLSSTIRAEVSVFPNCPP
jgi:hypothetical protein